MIHRCVCTCLEEKRCGCDDGNERWFIPCEDHLYRMQIHARTLGFYEKYFNFNPYELMVEAFNFYHPDHCHKELVCPLGLDEKYSRKAACMVADIHQDIPIASLNLGHVVVCTRTKEGLYTEPIIVRTNNTRTNHT